MNRPMTHEEGVEARRAIYAFSRNAKAAEIKIEAQKRCMALLRQGSGQPEEVRAGIRGEIMAHLIEAQAALDRLEGGRTS